MDKKDQLSFLDILNVLSFCIGVMNLEENLTQSDKQELQNDLSDKADNLLTEIHGHLEKQDAKLDNQNIVLNRLGAKISKILIALEKLEHENST